MTEPVTVAAASLRDLFASHIVEMRDSQAELIRAQMQMHQESLAIQTQLLERLAKPNEADPLRKLMEKDTQFQHFTRITEHFLAWITEFQMRKEQRNLQDAVAIQYAKKAMGETDRGLFDTTREFATWEEFL